MTELAGKNILVIGAHSVLAQELIPLLKASGANVTGTARSLHNINQGTPGTPSAPALTQLDLTDEHAVGAFIDSFALSGQPLHGVIVASGQVAFGPATDLPRNVVDSLMRVNAISPITLVTGLAPAIQASGGGFIVTLSGKIAELPTAGMAAYSASKAALFAYSVAAGRELRRSNIRWMDARPGHTETGLASRPIYGEAPALGAGLSPAFVAHRILEGILNDERDLPSSAFESSGMA